MKLVSPNSDDLKRIFSIGFKKFLDRKGLTQKRAAEIFGCSVQNIGSLATGNSLPTYEKIKQFIEYGMTLTEIFGDDISVFLTLSPPENKTDSLTPGQIVELGIAELLRKTKG